MIYKKKIYFEELLGSGYEMELLQWRNQEYVRKNMMDSEIISVEKHMSFLEKMKKEEGKKYYLMFYNNNPVAVLNFDSEGEMIESGMYLVRQEYLSCGYGLIAEYAKDKYVFENRKKEKLVTRVLEHNKKTLKFHERLNKKIIEKSIIIKSNGESENLYTFIIDREWWNQQKYLLQEKIEMIFNKNEIAWIDEEVCFDGR